MKLAYDKADDKKGRCVEIATPFGLAMTLAKRVFFCLKY